MTTFEFSHWQKRLLGSFCLLFVLALISLVGIVFVNQIKAGKYIGQDWQNQNTITVSGQGKLYAKPDLIIVNLSVKTEKKTPGEAMQENTKKMNNIIQKMRGLNILEKDIQTTNFSLYPRYEWRSKEIFPPTGKRVLAGYEIDQTIKVKVRKLDQISDVINTASKNGANQIGDLQLTIENPEKIKAETRLQAIQQAKVQARSLAQALGVHLGKIVDVQFDNQMPRPMMSKVMGSAMEGSTAGPQIATGQNLIQTTAKITYQIY